MRKLVLASALVVLPALYAFAAENPWVGTWKLDPAQSRSVGGSLTFSKSDNGLYHYSNGSKVSFDFGIDGKEYKSVYGHTVTWNAVGDKTWDSVRKRDGAVTSICGSTTQTWWCRFLSRRTAMASSGTILPSPASEIFAPSSRFPRSTYITQAASPEALP
jgi:hypothetical protein